MSVELMRNAALATIAALAVFLPTPFLNAQRPALWHITPELRIGQDTYDFSRIAAILPASDGSVVIADSRNNDIIVFGRSGEYLHKIGRTGRGPGEFGRLRAIGFLADTLWVIDGAERRVSFFTLDGKLAATIRIEGELATSSRWVPFLTALLPEGRALGLGAASMASGLGFGETLEPVLLMSRSGRAIDTLAWVPTRNRYVSFARPDGSTSFGEQRFSDASLVIFAPSSSSLFVVDRTVTTTSRNASFRVVALRANRDTIWNRSFAYQPRPLERTRADSLLTAMQRSYGRSGIAPAEIRRAVFIPDYYAPITSGIVASDGSLWLRREEGKPTVDYWIIGKDGALLSMVMVPANVTLLAASEANAWGIVKDEFDVPTVTRYRITR